MTQEVSVETPSSNSWPCTVNMCSSTNYITSAKCTYLISWMLLVVILYSQMLVTICLGTSIKISGSNNLAQSWKEMVWCFKHWLSYEGNVLYFVQNSVASCSKLPSSRPTASVWIRWVNSSISCINLNGPTVTNQQTLWSSWLNQYTFDPMGLL